MSSSTAGTPGEPSLAAGFERVNDRSEPSFDAASRVWTAWDAARTP